MFNDNLGGVGAGAGVAQITPGQADGYNFFPQKDNTLPLPTTKEDVMKNSIHIIMEVEFTRADGVPVVGPQWLNVVALKDNTILQILKLATSILLTLPISRILWMFRFLL